jgi:hypothetical protein
MDLFRKHLIATGRRRAADARYKYLTERQRAVVAGLYAWNSELKAGI